MKKLNICDLKPGLVTGVEVQLPQTGRQNKAGYFEWVESTLTVDFDTNKISGGVLKSEHDIPVFNEIETHKDNEMFYFISGTAIMPFIDINEGKPDMDTAQIVRIQPGTQIIIHAGKGHFVPVAENEEIVYIVVVSPKMDAIKRILPEPIGVRNCS